MPLVADKIEIAASYYLENKVLKDLNISREHFVDDPFLLRVFDDIAQLVFIAMQIRGQSKTFKNANLADSNVREEVIDTIECLEEIAGELLPLLFSRKGPKRKEKILADVRKRNTMLLASASSRASQLSALEKAHYEGGPAQGNTFRTVQYRLDVIRQAWAAG